MSSLRRVLSFRANGARSIGPVTAEGKRLSSQNATSHGLLARHIVMRDESPEAFDTVMNQHLDRLQPADGVEVGLVEEMVASQWRLRRAWALETRLLENEAAAQTAADPLDRLSAPSTTCSSCVSPPYQTNLVPFPNTRRRSNCSFTLVSCSMFPLHLSCLTANQPAFHQTARPPM